MSGAGADSAPAGGRAVDADRWIRVEYGAEFAKELKAYSKKWKTLAADLEIAKGVLTQIYGSDEIPDPDMLRHAFFDGKRAAILVRAERHEVVKMRLDCSSPGAEGKLRIIFIYLKTDDGITFIELYAKNDKDREDAKRVARYLKSISPA